MVTSLEEVQLFATYQIDDTVFLGEAPGPGTSRKVPEWFRFPDAMKGVAQDRLNDDEGPGGDPSIGFHPEPQVLQELELEYGDPLGRADDF